MKAYIISVIGAVFLMDLVAVLIPPGKTGKTVCGVVKIFGAFVMLLPAVSLINNVGYAFGETSYVETNSAYADKSVELRIENYILESYGLECDVKKRGYILTVYADKDSFPSKFEDDLKITFGENFTVIYEY